MFNKPKLLVIGGGTMGAICAQAAAAVLGKDNVTVLERTAAHASSLQNRLGVTCLTTLPNDAAFDIVVCAVKPQDATTALEPLRVLLSPTLVISVMAGIATERLIALTGSSRVVRCMPNTPAAIGQGMTVWTTTAGVTTTDRNFVQQWLKQLGADLLVYTDDWIDKATAVSASGPGYVFAFATDLLNSAIALGFSPEQATVLVQQTMSGSIALWQQTNTPPDALRDQVTSKGGTTQAALKVLAEAEVAATWKKAVAAAYQRAKDLQV